jgi:hypothetical protein
MPDGFAPGSLPIPTAADPLATAAEILDLAARAARLEAEAGHDGRIPRALADRIREIERLARECRRLAVPTPGTGA